MPNRVVGLRPATLFKKRDSFFIEHIRCLRLQFVIVVVSAIINMICIVIHDMLHAIAMIKRKIMKSKEFNLYFQETFLLQGKQIQQKQNTLKQKV